MRDVLDINVRPAEQVLTHFLALLPAANSSTPTRSLSLFGDIHWQFSASKQWSRDV